MRFRASTCNEAGELEMDTNIVAISVGMASEGMECNCTSTLGVRKTFPKLILRTSCEDSVRMAICLTTISLRSR